MTLLSDQIRAAIAELRAELDEQLEESLRVLLELAGGSEGEPGDLRSAFQEIDTATSESEVLCRLLEQCSTKAERVGLLLVKKDVFEGWAGIGFDQSTFGDLRLEVEDVAATTLQAAHSVTASTELEQALASALATPPPLDAVTIPFVLRGNTEALLYADRASSGAPLVVDDLRILCGFAAQTLELLTLRAGA